MLLPYVGVRIQKLHLFQPLSKNSVKWLLTFAEGSDGKQSKQKTFAHCSFTISVIFFLFAKPPKLCALY